MKRYVALITDEGFQAGLQLESNPEETIKKINTKHNLTDNQARVIFTFERGIGIEIEHWDFKDFKRNYIKRQANKVANDDDSYDLGSYMAYELRKRYVHGNMQTEVFYAMDKEDQADMVSRNPYEVGFHILDLCIMGKTTLNRFSKPSDIEKEQRVVHGVQLNKDFDDKKKAKFKRLRQMMMGHLKADEEGPDEV